ncbi:class I SAM-dependent methyltransferase (plasmid) [Streptomyces clavuligerus]|uniref:Methyltransferase type 12 n=1 Tax=Streptomyces clavuligerus TaxID=1901 RepID=B5GM41_STRCL|nr:class I SAM-dependent methyltransferase [Streptomyces clavuligerus]EDY47387.1 methyltransferase type 12 [Streptomyces clavuligerus]EFG05042.1 Methyltransferase type 12 [Streptomyces clavuligerus]MBY6306549.1 class I SAM-dependent methyltransferase [Streptomyces clavuligerus]QCS10842.1 class I SAM-dependent methyltransferase [Streptomyces clavuligerus]QPJ97118.1 methyltransferase domain-containing protein [Streptomyces clavuligerus]
MSGRTERYGDVLFNHAAPNERACLDSLGAVLDPTTTDVLKAVPGQRGLRLLEVAAGTGTVARWMAVHFTEGRVTATELDTRFLHTHGHRNLTVQRHDVTRDGFPAACFDVIHARYLLSHLPSRARVLGDLVRWLAPGGTLMVEDPSLFSLRAARDDTYRRVSLGAVHVLRSRIGTDSDEWPTSLAERFTNRGLTDINLRVMVPTVSCGTPMAAFWKLTLEHLAPALVELPGINRSDILYTLDRMSLPGFVDLGMATYTVTGRKPANGLEGKECQHQ